MQYEKDCVYHLYWLIIEKRDRFIEYMKSKGIETGTHYKPIHTMSAYKQFERQPLPVTNSIGNKIVTVPMHPNLNDGEIEYIIKTINEY